MRSGDYRFPRAFAWLNLTQPSMPIQSPQPPKAPRLRKESARTPLSQTTQANPFLPPMPPPEGTPRKAGIPTSCPLSQNRQARKSRFLLFFQNRHHVLFDASGLFSQKHTPHPRAHRLESRLTLDLRVIRFLHPHPQNYVLFHVATSSTV